MAEQVYGSYSLESFFEASSSNTRPRYSSVRFPRRLQEFFLPLRVFPLQTYPVLFEPGGAPNRDRLWRHPADGLCHRPKGQVLLDRNRQCWSKKIPERSISGRVSISYCRVEVALPNGAHQPPA